MQRSVYHCQNQQISGVPVINESQLIVFEYISFTLLVSPQRTPSSISPYGKEKLLIISYTKSNN